MSIAMESKQRDIRRLAIAAYVGTALEWYDFFLYGTAAALVFNKLFFPSLDPVIGTIASFTTFAVGFIARPFGAALFGHIGDRHGRKQALIITVVLMGCATGLMGLLPGYDSIGIAAPILLATLRFLQGVSVGGEWGGAMLLTLEHAPEKRHGLYAAIPQLGSPTGTLLSSGAFALVGLLPDDQFYAWGWRIPFLAAFLLLFVGLYLRVRIEESPLFRKVMAENKRERLPLITALRTSSSRMGLSVMAAVLGIGGFFLVSTFMINYGTAKLGVAKSVMLNATLVGAVVEIVILWVFGLLADRIGAWRVCALGGVATIIAAFPVFWLVGTGNTALIVLGVSLGFAVVSIPYAPIGALVAQMFTDESRYSAVAMSYNLAGVVGGLVPLITESLLAGTGQAAWVPPVLLAVIALITTVGSAGAGAVLRRRRFFGATVDEVAVSHR